MRTERVRWRPIPSSQEATTHSAASRSLRRLPPRRASADGHAVRGPTRCLALRYVANAPEQPRGRGSRTGRRWSVANERDSSTGMRELVASAMDREYARMRRRWGDVGPAKESREPEEAWRRLPGGGVGFPRSALFYVPRSRSLARRTAVCDHRDVLAEARPGRRSYGQGGSDPYHQCTARDSA